MILIGAEMQITFSVARFALPSTSRSTRRSSLCNSRPRVGRPSSGARATRALAELTAAGIAVDQFALGQPSLDEVFLALTGRPAHVSTEAQEAQ